MGIILIPPFALGVVVDRIAGIRQLVEKCFPVQPVAEQGGE
jgi:hypothetical protein